MATWSPVAAWLAAGLLAVSSSARAVDGDPDAAFGGTGDVTLSPGPIPGGDVQVLAQTDGRVVVIGIVSSGAALGVTRLQADGTIDTAFGTNGTAVIDVPSGGTALSALGALDAAGRVVAGGTVDFGDHSVMFVARLTSAGQPDPGFHGGSPLAITRSFVTSQGDTVTAIGVFSDPLAGDSRIFVAGSMQDQYGVLQRALAVVPLNADGSYVTGAGVGNDSFFFGGVENIAHCYRTGFAGDASDDSAAALALRWYPGSATELIAVAGNSFSIGTVPGFGVVAELDGSLHPIASFGNSGVSEFIFGTSGAAQVNAIALDASDRVLVAGIDASTAHYNLGLGRILTNGYYDTSFNGNGRVIVDFDESGHTFYSEGVALLVQHDGRILIGGQITQASAAVEFGLVRVTAAGVPDATFTSGTTITGAHKYPFSAGNDYANSAAFTQGEKVLLAGIVGQPTDAFGVLRVAGDRIFGDGMEPVTYVPRVP